MGNKKSKSKSKPSGGKLYKDDPVFGRMVYSQTAGAWVPAEYGNQYEDIFASYASEREKNKKYLKNVYIKPEKINNYYEDIHQSLSLIKKANIELGIYNYVYFLNDGRLALNFDYQLNIYSKDFETIEQTIHDKSIFITQLKDNSLVNCVYNGANIYKYNEETKQFALDYSLKCINNAEKVIELSNDRLALLADNISIYFKENGKYIKNGEDLIITTIDDFIPINDHQIASISGQESEITFWSLTTRKIISQIGEIKTFGRSCMILFGLSLIVGGASRNDSVNYIYIINTIKKELIKKYSFNQNIWFMIKLNKNEFITGETEGIINKYRFENNEVKIMEINKDHGNAIVQRLSFCPNNNHLASLSNNKYILFKFNE